MKFVRIEDQVRDSHSARPTPAPRRTGETTWLTDQLPSAIWFDLLQARNFIPLMRNPELFAQHLDAQAGGWVVIDEVQRLPWILDELHGIMDRHPLATGCLPAIRTSASESNRIDILEAYVANYLQLKTPRYSPD